MIWNAEQNIQLRPAEGNSGVSPFCVPTSAGCFIGDRMKTCSKCKEAKLISEFHKDRERKDGLRGYCKSCQKVFNSNRKHRRGNKKVKEYNRIYLKTEKGKIVHRKGNKRYGACHPNNIKARRAVNSAVRAGKLPRADSLQCHFCPAQAKQYHHHKGYALKHWLDVISTCVDCHRKCQKKIA